MTAAVRLFLIILVLSYIRNRQQYFGRRCRNVREGRVLTPSTVNGLERLELNNILWYPHKKLLLIGCQNRIDSKRSHPA